MKRIWTTLLLPQSYINNIQTPILISVFVYSNLFVKSFIEASLAGRTKLCGRECIVIMIGGGKVKKGHEQGQKEWSEVRSNMSRILERTEHESVTTIELLGLRLCVLFVPRN